jgi:hypothetical protein
MSSSVMCAGLILVGEDGGNGKGSVVMCAGFLQGGGEEWKWNGFSGDVFWFSAGRGRRRGMRNFSVLMRAGLLQGGVD